MVMSSAVHKVRRIRSFRLSFAEMIGYEVNRQAADNNTCHNVQAPEIGKFTSDKCLELFRYTSRANLSGIQKH
jgi:hypothetical protein